MGVGRGVAVGVGVTDGVDVGVGVIVGVGVTVGVAVGVTVGVGDCVAEGVGVGVRGVPNSSALARTLTKASNPPATSTMPLGSNAAVCQ